MEKAYKKMTSHGSINVPVAMRRNLGIEPKDPMVVEEKDGNIVISPYTPRCLFCGTTEIAGLIGGKGICHSCAEKAYKELGGAD
jgi:transcriptional pleiotropic regulator of transition state genes